MRFSYRITKYRYLDADNHLRSSNEDWTSFHDVGTKTTLEEYLRIEAAYIDSVLAVCQSLSVTHLRVRELEATEGVAVEEGAELDLSEVEHVVRALLREEYWCKLTSQELEFHFGYDYHMYLVSNLDASSILMRLNQQLFIQEFRSPYLDSDKTPERCAATCWP